MSNKIRGISRILFTDSFNSSLSYQGIAEKGCLLCDISNGILYINTGHVDSVTWNGFTGGVVTEIAEEGFGG